jgi:SAM-dependent methyltransferase
MNASGDGRQPDHPGNGGYTGVENLEVMADAVNYNRFLTDLVLSGIKSGTRIVDFGAGAGTFAKPVSAAGFDVVCVEPDETLRSLLVERHLTCVADVSSIPSGSADYAYSLNVLEHIEDDAAALKELFRILRPGGRLLIYVPAFQALFSSMDRKVGHFRRYRLRHLCGIISCAGFDVLQKTYADCLGFPATLAYKLVDRGGGTVNRKGLRVYDRYAFPASRVLDRVFGRWFGKNALVVAEKPLS